MPRLLSRRTFLPVLAAGLLGGRPLLATTAPGAGSRQTTPRPVSGTGAFSPVNYGARCDGITNDAPAIQAAIDAAYANGGGTVVIPAGAKLLTGSFELKSHVTLHLEPGSRLLASTQRGDYRGNVLIHALAAEDIAITGTGTLDGRSPEFVAEELPHFLRPKSWRPRLMILEGCRGVRLRDFTIRHSPSWTIHLAGCDDVLADGLTIRNDLRFPNCDGIDPDHSRNVRISNCHIESGDDCIVIKNLPAYAKYGPAENIVVTNCTLVSTSAALKIGTETVDDIRDVVFSNCVIRGSHRGFALMLRDQGSIENVLVQNLTIETRLFDPVWWGAAEPISITALPRTAGGRIGRIRGVRCQDILARGEGGVFLSGSAESVLEDIRLENIQVELQRRTEYLPGRIDLRPSPGGAPTPGPLIGYHIRHARDVALRECTVRWAMPRPSDARALKHDVATEEIRVDGFRELPPG